METKDFSSAVSPNNCLMHINISLITGWSVCTEKYKARGPDV